MAETESTPAQKHSRRKRAFIIAGVVLLVLVAAGAGVALRLWQSDRTNMESSGGLPEQPESVQRAQDLLAQGDIDQADKYVKENLNDESLPDEERFQLYVAQGLIAYEKQDYQEAADAYTKAFDIQETYEVARKLGSTWQQLGDNQKAIELYKKAIELNPQDNPVREADNNILEQMISNLEGQQ